MRDGACRRSLRVINCLLEGKKTARKLLIAIALTSASMTPGAGCSWVVGLYRCDN